ncbi:hypothetical protein LCGC14_1287580 [marine sediment metagenome]|uniref:Uncharacterized protein n=1 Tax=marine sediment metagenome TaxID=412755 RepID=A0A0F9KV49_9ZZZZ
MLRREFLKWIGISPVALIPSDTIKIPTSEINVKDRVFVDTEYPIGLKGWAKVLAKTEWLGPDGENTYFRYVVQMHGTSNRSEVFESEIKKNGQKKTISNIKLGDKVEIITTKEKGILVVMNRGESVLGEKWLECYIQDEEEYKRHPKWRRLKLCFIEDLIKIA